MVKNYFEVCVGRMCFYISVVLWPLLNGKKNLFSVQVWRNLEEFILAVFHLEKDYWKTGSHPRKAYERGCPNVCSKFHPNVIFYF